MKDMYVDNAIEQFMTLFNKMFSETKYNLQALNKRMESLDKCFNNIMLLKSDKPFEEDNQQNFGKNKYSNNNNNEENKNLKITSKELDEIEKMFFDMEEPKGNDLMNKKRKGDSTFDIYDYKKKDKKIDNKKYNMIYDEEEYWK